MKGVTKRDIGERVTCAQGGGVLKHVSNTPYGRLALIRMDSNGTKVVKVGLVEVVKC